jgi:hypothetical protein
MFLSRSKNLKMQDGKNNIFLNRHIFPVEVLSIYMKYAEMNVYYLFTSQVVGTGGRMEICLAFAIWLKPNLQSTPLFNTTE